MHFARWSAPAWVAVSFGVMAAAGHYAKPTNTPVKHYELPKDMIRNTAEYRAAYNACIDPYVFQSKGIVGIFPHMECDRLAHASVKK